MPQIAAEIATRLLAAGRAGDALGFIDRAALDKNHFVPREWEDARIAVLEALDRRDEAQAFRWECFERGLSSEHLRDYLKRLPDFEDIDAEDRAMAHAATHHNLLPPLGFFLEWPAPDHAARLLIARHKQINGDNYEFLVPAAEAVAERYPVAATVALRAMIDFTLNETRAKRYGYAAQHLATCADLVRRIEDFSPIEPHDEYVARLKARHGKKTGFWSKVEGT
jgi:hypothetical protein